jgi:hypothetical protein
MSVMDWEAVKLIGVAVGLISGALTVGEKLCKWGKSAYQYIKKLKKVVALGEGSGIVPVVQSLKKHTWSGHDHAKRPKPLTVIGDAAQAIYRFRGAYPLQSYYRFYM